MIGYKLCNSIHKHDDEKSIKKINTFYVRSQNYGKLVLASTCLSVRISACHVGMEQLGSHWTTSHEISYLTIF
jgi:hypothetical protein